MENAIEVRGLTKAHGDFLLHGVDLTVRSGEVTGVVGPNGAGKTTLIRCLLGIERPDAGEVELLGVRDPWAGHDGVRLREAVAVVPDGCPFPAMVTVGDVAALGRRSFDRWDPKPFDELCARFSLRDDARVQDLSRGMAMGLTIAFALARPSRLLILDEATAGLDPMARDEVLGLVRTYMADGDHTVLMTTHITSDLDKIADQVVGLEAGQVAFSVSMDEMVDGACLVRVGETDLARLIDLLGPDLCWQRHPYETIVLARDRAAVERALPGVRPERPSVEQYMTLVLAGEGPMARGRGE